MPRDIFTLVPVRHFRESGAHAGDGSWPRSYGRLPARQCSRQAWVVYDLMEPQRPVMDRKVLEFVQSHTFHPVDFTIRPDGACRLNPEMAKHLTKIGLRDLDVQFEHSTSMILVGT